MKNYMGTDGFVWFQGVVEDRDDPLKLGRVRVRCLGWHTQENATKFEPRYVLTEDLPWAHVMLPINYNQNTVGPRLGDWVMGFFRDGLEAQEPFIMGIIPHIPQELPKENPEERLGFEDPSGTYPKNPDDWPEARNHWVNEPRTNRLARSENTEETVIQLKNESVTSNVGTGVGAGKILAVTAEGIPVPLTSNAAANTTANTSANTSANTTGPFLDVIFTGGTGSGASFDVDIIRDEDVYSVSIVSEGIDYLSGDVLTVSGNTLGGTSPNNDLTITIDEVSLGEEWSEPTSTYASVYPFNRVEESESGHIREVDDTPGVERIHEYHRAGTFYEIDADGNKVTRVVGDKYEVIAGNNFVNIKGDANLTVNGALNIIADSIRLNGGRFIKMDADVISLNPPHAPGVD